MRKKINIPQSVIEANKLADRPIHSEEDSILKDTAENEEIRYQLMDLTRNRKVAISNELVFAPQPMTAIEVKLLRIILSQIESYDTDDVLKEENMVYATRAKDIAKKIGHAGGGSVYTSIRQAALSLNKRSFFYHDEATDDWLNINWFSYIRYNDGKGEISLKLNPDLFRFIRNLQNNFSIYSLELLLSFKSRYSIRLYEAIFAKIQRDDKTRAAYNAGSQVSVIFDVDELKVLTATLHKYTDQNGRLRIGQFKKKVIDVAVQEISEKSEINVRGYATKSIGSRSINTFEFFCTYKKAEQSSYLVSRTEKAGGAGIVAEDAQTVIDDRGEWNEVYLKNLFGALLTDMPPETEMMKLLAAYDSAEAFNKDLRKALPRAKKNIVGYMLKMVENREPADIQKRENSVMDDSAKLSLSYVKSVFDAWHVSCDLDRLGEIYAQFIGNTPGFNAYFMAEFASQSFPKAEIKSAPEKNAEGQDLEEAFLEITEYWNDWCLKIQMDIPNEGDLYLPKTIKRTTKMQRQYFAKLLEDGETAASIKKAIDVAVFSQYFLRTRGSFGFFINPKNYYDIAAGERDYDSETARLWRQGR